MRRVGQVRRRDTAEGPIVRALEAVGAQVVRCSEPGAPDVFVFHRGQWYAAEIKSKGGRLTPAQVEAGAGATWPVWRTPGDALTALGLKAVDG